MSSGPGIGARRGRRIPPASPTAGLVLNNQEVGEP